MRSSLLDPLFASLTNLAGVGPKQKALFARLLDREEPRLLDLLLHLPASVVDRRSRPTIAELTPGTSVTLDVIVDRHQPAPPGRGKAPHRVWVHDATGEMLLVFFRGEKGWIERLLPVGEQRFVSGTVEFWDGVAQIVHPDRMVSAAEFARLPLVEPVYPLTEGLAIGAVRRAAQGALERLPKLPEWQSAAGGRDWSTFTAALTRLHSPQVPEDIAPESPAWARLAYDELLSQQIALQLLRTRMRRNPGRRSQAAGNLQALIESVLPFSLTEGQKQAVAEIRADLSGPERMLRLLQGDVGSGKTLVALLAMAHVVEAGRQAALMAPTDILARQHFERIQPLAFAAGISCALLTGRDRGKARERTLAAIAAGEVDIVIGTHALFQNEVRFADLALAIVDEQHRFGVHQRLALAHKGEAADLLVMTATPIPRTLVMAYFGDMDVSSLREKPAGRQPIATRALPLDRIDDVIDGLGRAIAKGARAYWICPLVDESETLDVAAASERAEVLRQFFGARVGLAHGKMKGADKDAAMAAFAAGETSILVATTVVEVGVDVPEATIIVIEHAERFGLAQLHQLRGRVGRGAAASACILLYKPQPGENALARIDVLRHTEDGFVISEEDLRLRGGGDVLGAKQSGFPGFKVVRPEAHMPLMQPAHEEARRIVEADPLLASERGQAVRMLLHIFEREEAVRMVEAG